MVLATFIMTVICNKILIEGDIMKKFFAVSILVLAFASVLASLQLSATPSNVVANENDHPIAKEQGFEFIEFEPMEFKVESSIVR